MKYLRTICVLLASTALAAEPTTASSPSQPASQPADIRRGSDMRGDREQRRREYYERLIKRVEPSGHPDIARLPQYLDFFRREFIDDTRTMAFDVRADGKLLQGFVEFPEQEESLARFFEHLNLPGVKREIDVLPKTALGEKKYAFVVAAHVFLYDKPTGERREQLTECVQGDVIYLLKDAAGQVLCHAPDGYVGYIAADKIRRVDEATLSTVEAVVPTRRADDVEHVVEAAGKLLGVKYVWGGTTSDGCDCSGLVRQAFRSIKMNLPRDADQKALLGRLVGTRWYRAGLRRGDTLYFLGHNGQIHHTALYIGDGKFIEATEPVAKISSFDSDDPQYSERRDKSFCFAKRILE
jgi:gamma-D-glutamyl-L-lysine dipeptidyl-peptidase